jgi:UDP-glucose 4-epimerase
MLGTGDRGGSGRTIESQIVGRKEVDREACLAEASKGKALFRWDVKFDIDWMCDEIWRFNGQNPMRL